MRDAPTLDTGRRVEATYQKRAPAVEAVSKRGEVYELGRHRLLCGDATSVADIEKLMNGALGDMVFTDPPYGVSIGDKNVALNSVHRAGHCLTNLQHDTLSPEMLYEVLLLAFTNFTSCWFIDKPRANAEHPTMKPVALVENALLNSSDREDRCVDLFCGSGTTLLACEQTSRIGYGMEIDPRYCDVIRDRYARFVQEPKWAAHREQMELSHA